MYIKFSSLLLIAMLTFSNVRSQCDLLNNATTLTFRSSLKSIIKNIYFKYIDIEDYIFPSHLIDSLVKYTNTECANQMILQIAQKNNENIGNCKYFKYINVSMNESIMMVNGKMPYAKLRRIRGKDNRYDVFSFSKPIVYSNYAIFQMKNKFNNSTIIDYILLYKREENGDWVLLNILANFAS